MHVYTRISVAPAGYVYVHIFYFVTVCIEQLCFWAPLCLTVFMVLHLIFFVTFFILPFSELSLVGLAVDPVDTVGWVICPIVLKFQSFAVNGPLVWNSLPAELQWPDILLDIFKARLKTFLCNFWLSAFGVFYSNSALYRFPY